LGGLSEKSRIPFDRLRVSGKTPLKTKPEPLRAEPFDGAQDRLVEASFSEFAKSGRIARHCRPFPEHTAYARRLRMKLLAAKKIGHAMCGRVGEASRWVA
jgi:hypothetical protein